MDINKKYIILSDGTIYEGIGFGFDAGGGGGASTRKDVAVSEKVLSFGGVGRFMNNSCPIVNDKPKTENSIG